MDTIKRVDPPNCGCTDCATGYSKPVNRCSEKELCSMIIGTINNATGEEPVIAVPGADCVEGAAYPVMTLKGYLEIVKAQQDCRR